MTMLGIMMWLTGSGVNIFSIMITGYGLISPLKALLGTPAGTAARAERVRYVTEELW